MIPSLSSKRVVGLILLVLTLQKGGLAAAPASSAGLTLLESPSARAAALGEAFSALENDVSAQVYNPASVATLEAPQTSVMYKKGLADDGFGQVLFGGATPIRGLGFSLGYYSGGDVDLFDGTSSQTVTAQKDFVAGVRYAQKRGRLSLGLAGKYLSSELAEAERASAVAGDIGLQIALQPHVRLGASLQNIGASLRYIRNEHRLPRIARMGVAMPFFEKTRPTLFLFEVPYDLNAKEAHPALGLEVNVAPLALRMGYQTGFDAKGLSVGLGFTFQNMELGYAFGFSNEFNDLHRVSLTYQFLKRNKP